MIEINNLQGDLTEISAKKEQLLSSIPRLLDSQKKVSSDNFQAVTSISVNAQTNSSFT